MKIFKDVNMGIGLILATLLSSCGQHYSNEIIQWTTAQECHFKPVNDSIASLDAAGYIRITYSKDAPNANPEICDSVYIVGKTWWQAWEQGKKDGSVLIFWISLILTILFIGVFIHFLENQRESDGKWPLGWLVPVFACAIVCGFALEWDKWNTDREIRKQDFVQYIQQDGDLHNFWTTPVKHY
jgi:hypothetical protein